jgi:hypothetical protein
VPESYHFDTAAEISGKPSAQPQMPHRDSAGEATSLFDMALVSNLSMPADSTGPPEGIELSEAFCFQAALAYPNTETNDSFSTPVWRRRLSEHRSRGHLAGNELHGRRKLTSGDDHGDAFVATWPVTQTTLAEVSPTPWTPRTLRSQTPRTPRPIFEVVSPGGTCNCFEANSFGPTPKCGSPASSKVNGRETTENTIWSAACSEVESSRKNKGAVEGTVETHWNDFISEGGTLDCAIHA